MNAAVVHAFGEAPVYAPFDTPAVPSDPDEMLVDVLAVGVHPRTRSGASGSHYTSTGALPMIPGVDGVGRGPDGRLRYFVLDDPQHGSLADHVVIDSRHSAVLSDDTDVPTVAAAMNPAMSSWIALRQRITFSTGENVVVLGATGGAGQMAVQIAKHLGAAHVVAAGRDPERLASLSDLGADVTVSLAGDPEVAARALGEAATDADVVIDYLWGPATEHNMGAVLTQRADRSRPLTWIEIGSMSGLEITLPSAWLRSARLQIVGSGIGSVNGRDLVGELPALAEQITTGSYAIDAVATPLSEVTEAWNRPVEPGRRLVFVP